MQVQVVGDHKESPNLKRIKQHDAIGSTLRVPQHHARFGRWKKIVHQLQNARNLGSRKTFALGDRKRVISADCLGSLRSFAGSTPATVKIDESSMLWTETEVRILFCCSGAEQQMAKLKLSGFL